MPIKRVRHGIPRTSEDSPSETEGAGEALNLVRIGGELGRLFERLGIPKAAIGRSERVQGAAILVVVALLFAIARVVLGVAAWPSYVAILLTILFVVLLYRVIAVATRRRPARVAGDFLVVVVLLLTAGLLITGFTAVVFQWPPFIYKLIIRL